MVIARSWAASSPRRRTESSKGKSLLLAQPLDLDGQGPRARGWPSTRWNAGVGDRVLLVLDGQGGMMASRLAGQTRPHPSRPCVEDEQDAVTDAAVPPRRWPSRGPRGPCRQVERLGQEQLLRLRAFRFLWRRRCPHTPRSPSAGRPMVHRCPRWPGRWAPRGKNGKRGLAAADVEDLLRLSCPHRVHRDQRSARRACVGARGWITSSFVPSSPGPCARRPRAATRARTP